MLPSIGFPELVVVVLLALVVVGPKDMPHMMRKLSGFLRKIRALGDEFKGAFNDMAKDTELDELRREINELKSLGRLGDLTNGKLEDEMRSLDVEIRSDLRSSSSSAHPRVSPKASYDGGDDGKV